MKYTPAEIETYYRIRLDPFGLRHYKGTRWRSRCSIHGGANPTSLAVDFEDGKFYCFSRQCKGGSIFAFEQEMLRAESGGAQAPGNDLVHESIKRIIGTPLNERIYVESPKHREGDGWNRKLARDYYPYIDLKGDEAYTVWRFVYSDGRKVTPPDMPCPCTAGGECKGCTNGRVWGWEGRTRILYRWQDVVQSALVFIVEGEKNANDLHRALSLYTSKNKGFRMGKLTLDRVAVTTNAGGASAWKEEYNYGREFQSKVVVKLGDNDVAGRKHTEDVCRDVSRYASELYTLDLPVGPGEDISDFLANHTIEDFLKLQNELKPWKTSVRVQAKMPKDTGERIVLVSPSRLVDPQTSTKMDWLVSGLIERNTRGLVVAPPKVGKSLLFLDMAVALSTGTEFLSTEPYHRPVRTAIVSREDGPTLVHRRLTQLCIGRGLDPRVLDRNMLINTERQSASFQIDRQEDLDEMAEWLSAGEVEFTVIDVLNKLHGGKENSTDDMTAVMKKFDELAKKSGSQVCVIHHSNASGNSRGSSAITGWADYIVRMERDAEDDSIKRFYVATKSTGQVAPRTVKYWQSEDKNASRIMLVIPEVAPPQAFVKKHWSEREHEYTN